MKLRLAFCALFITATFAACGGPGGSSIGIGGPGLLASQHRALSVSSSPAPSPSVVVLTEGGVLGVDDQFTPHDGDTPTGGQGKNVDGIPCDAPVSTYHFHSHVSLLVNGTRIAIPDAIGIMNPGPEVKGSILTGSCFYHIHTHDADGYIHIENDVSPNFTLGQLFDIWGQPLSAGNIAGYTGSTMFFIAHAPYGFNNITGPYSRFTGDPRTIPLRSHREIVLEVGPTFVTPPQLPPVEFWSAQ